jgi:hypothetical protein
MMASRLWTFVLATVAMMAGAVTQAQQPPQSAQAATAAAPSPDASAAHPVRKAAMDGKATAAPAATDSAARAPTDPSAQLLRDARNAGFRPQNVRGTLMFCRVAVELGSNFPVRTCYNEQQVRIKIRQYQEQRNQLEQTRQIPPVCRPPNC